MIAIKRYGNGVIVKGHAGYAESGKDIVCAAISTLTDTLIESINQLTNAEVSVAEDNGYTEIKYIEQNEIIEEHGSVKIMKRSNDTQLLRFLFAAFMIGCKGVAETYPDYVMVDDTPYECF